MPYYAGLGDQVAKFAEGWVRQTKGRWAGKPLTLEEWQRDLLTEMFLVDETGKLVYREALIGVPRKNGKSTLAAAIGLYMLVAMGEQSPEVYAAAASKDQARVVFDQARGFVEASPRLRQWLEPMRNVIVCKSNDGIFRVLSSDAPLQHGLNPSGVVIDELWAHKDPELYYALTTGQLARENPLAVSITTAGFDKDSILWQVYKHGKQLHDRGVDAMRDGRFLFRWFQAPDDCDLEDEKAWRAANPSSWIDLEDLRIERLRLPEHVFRRLHLNQWTTAEEHWLPPNAWDRCEDEAAKIADHARVALGVDLGLKHDCAAVTVVHLIGDKGDRKAGPFEGEAIAQTTIFEPPGDGTALSIGKVEQHIRDLATKYDVRLIAYDPWRFSRSAELLEAEGLPMMDFPMTNERTAPASERLYEAIVQRKILHDGDTEFAAHVEAGTTIDTERGWRLTKRKAKEKVDALMALLIAYEYAVTVPDKPKFNLDDYRIGAV